MARWVCGLMGPRSTSGGVRDIIAASVERTWTAGREAEKPAKPDESARPAVAAASIVPCDEEIGVQIGVTHPQGISATHPPLS